MKIKRILWAAVLLPAAVGIVTAGSLIAAEAGKAAGKETETEKKFEEDTIKTKSGDLKITFIGHGTLMFSYQGRVIHIDPWSKLADYTKMPRADLILLTHEHGDHLDPKALSILRKEQTRLVLTELCAKKVAGRYCYEER